MGLFRREKPRFGKEKLEEIKETEIGKASSYPEDTGKLAEEIQRENRSEEETRKLREAEFQEAKLGMTTPPEGKPEKKEEKLYIDIAAEKLEKALDKVGGALGKIGEKLPQKQERVVEDATWKTFDKLGEGIAKMGEKLPQKQEKAMEDAVWKAFDKMGDWTAKGGVGIEKGIRKGVRELIKIGKSPRLESIKKKWKEKWREKIKKAKPEKIKEKLERTFSWRKKLVEKIFKKRKGETKEAPATVAAEAEELGGARQEVKEAYGENPVEIGTPEDWEERSAEFTRLAEEFERKAKEAEASNNIKDAEEYKERAAMNREGAESYKRIAELTRQEAEQTKHGVQERDRYAGYLVDLGYITEEGETSHDPSRLRNEEGEYVIDEKTNKPFEFKFYSEANKFLEDELKKRNGKPAETGEVMPKTPKERGTETPTEETMAKKAAYEFVKAELERKDRGLPNNTTLRIRGVEEFLEYNGFPAEAVKKMTADQAWSEARKIVEGVKYDWVRPTLKDAEEEIEKGNTPNGMAIKLLAGWLIERKVNKKVVDMMTPEAVVKRVREIYGKEQIKLGGE